MECDLPRGRLSPPRLPVEAALTVLEDSLHVEAVGGAGLVVGAAFQLVGEFSGSAVVDDPRVGRADGV